MANVIEIAVKLTDNVTEVANKAAEGLDKLNAAAQGIQGGGVVAAHVEGLTAVQQQAEQAATSVTKLAVQAEQVEKKLEFGDVANQARALTLLFGDSAAGAIAKYQEKLAAARAEQKKFTDEALAAKAAIESLELTPERMRVFATGGNVTVGGVGAVGATASPEMFADPEKARVAMAGYADAFKEVRDATDSVVKFKMATTIADDLEAQRKAVASLTTTWEGLLAAEKSAGEAAAAALNAGKLDTVTQTTNVEELRHRMESGWGIDPNLAKMKAGADATVIPLVNQYKAAFESLSEAHSAKLSAENRLSELEGSFGALKNIIPGAAAELEKWNKILADANAKADAFKATLESMTAKPGIDVSGGAMYAPPVWFKDAEKAAELEKKYNEAYKAESAAMYEGDKAELKLNKLTAGSQADAKIPAMTARVNELALAYKALGEEIDKASEVAVEKLNKIGVNPAMSSSYPPGIEQGITVGHLDAGWMQPEIFKDPQAAKAAMDEQVAVGKRWRETMSALQDAQDELARTQKMGTIHPKLESGLLLGITPEQLDLIAARAQFAAAELEKLKNTVLGFRTVNAYHLPEIAVEGIVPHESAHFNKAARGDERTYFWSDQAAANRAMTDRSLEEVKNEQAAYLAFRMPSGIKGRPDPEYRGHSEYADKARYLAGHVIPPEDIAVYDNVSGKMASLSEVVLKLRQAIEEGAKSGKSLTDILNEQAQTLTKFGVMEHYTGEVSTLTGSALELVKALETINALLADQAKLLAALSPLQMGQKVSGQGEVAAASIQKIESSVQSASTHGPDVLAAKLQAMAGQWETTVDKFAVALARAGEAAKQTSTGATVGSSLTPYTAEQLREKHARTFLSPDEKTGFAIIPNELGLEGTSLFNIGRAGMGQVAFAMQSALGMNNLDAFAPVLPQMYAQHGFRETKREANWTPGGPDVVYMTKQAEMTDAIRAKVIGLISEYEKLNGAILSVGQTASGATHQEQSSRFLSMVAADPKAWLQRYFAEQAGPRRNVIDPDAAKNLFPEYVANPAAMTYPVHEASSVVAKMAFEDLLEQAKAEGRSPHVAIMAGGAGSGKTAATKGIRDAADIVYDTTGSSKDSVRRTIEQTLAAGGTASVQYVLRDAMESYNAALTRALPEKPGGPAGRIPPAEIAAEQHRRAPEAFMALAGEYANNPNVAFNVIDNRYGRGNQRLLEGRAGIEALRGADVLKQTEADLAGQFSQLVAQRLREGTIPESVAAAALVHPRASEAGVARGAGGVETGVARPPGLEPGLFSGAENLKENAAAAAALDKALGRVVETGKAARAVTASTSTAFSDQGRAAAEAAVRLSVMQENLAHATAQSIGGKMGAEWDRALYKGRATPEDLTGKVQAGQIAMPKGLEEDYAALQRAQEAMAASTSKATDSMQQQAAVASTAATAGAVEVQAVTAQADGNERATATITAQTDALAQQGAAAEQAAAKIHSITTSTSDVDPTKLQEVSDALMQVMQSATDVSPEAQKLHAELRRMDSAGTLSAEGLDKASAAAEVLALKASMLGVGAAAGMRQFDEAIRAAHAPEELLAIAKQMEAAAATTAKAGGQFQSAGMKLKEAFSAKFGEGVAKLKEQFAGAGGAAGGFAAILGGVVGAAAVSMVNAVVNAIGQALSRVSQFFASVGQLAEEHRQRQMQSMEFGLSTEQLETIEYAAKRTGASVGMMQEAMRMMADSVRNNEAVWSRYHISLKTAGGEIKDKAQLFYDLADAVAAAGTQQERAAIVTDVLGRSGLRWIAMLSLGSEGLKKLAEEGHRLGAILNSEDEAAMVELANVNAKVALQWEGMWTQLKVRLVPAMMALAAASSALVTILPAATAVAAAFVAVWAAPLLAEGIAAAVAGIAALTASLPAFAAGITAFLTSIGPMGWALLALGGAALAAKAAMDKYNESARDAEEHKFKVATTVDLAGMSDAEKKAYQIKQRLMEAAKLSDEEIAAANKLGKELALGFQSKLPASGRAFDTWSLKLRIDTSSVESASESIQKIIRQANIAGGPKITVADIQKGLENKSDILEMQKQYNDNWEIARALTGNVLQNIKANPDAIKQANAQIEQMFVLEGNVNERVSKAAKNLGTMKFADVNEFLSALAAVGAAFKVPLDRMKQLADSAHAALVNTDNLRFLTEKYGDAAKVVAALMGDITTSLRDGGDKTAESLKALLASTAKAFDIKTPEATAFDDMVKRLAGETFATPLEALRAMAREAEKVGIEPTTVAMQALRQEVEQAKAALKQSRETIPESIGIVTPRMEQVDRAAQLVGMNIVAKGITDATEATREFDAALRQVKLDPSVVKDLDEVKARFQDIKELYIPFGRAAREYFTQIAESITSPFAVAHATIDILMQGIDRAISDIVDSLFDRTKSIGDAFKNMTREIMAELIKLMIRIAILKAIEGATGGFPLSALLGLGGGGKNVEAQPLQTPRAFQVMLPEPVTQALASLPALFTEPAGTPVRASASSATSTTTVGGTRNVNIHINALDIGTALDRMRSPFGSLRQAFAAEAERAAI